MMTIAPQDTPRPGQVTARRYGVVMFDDLEDPKIGWASVNGDPAYSISGMHDLPTDTLWLTNLNYENFRNSKVDLNPWMRMESYLPMKFKDMLAEWGHDPANSSYSFTATFCSQLFQRIMGMSWDLVRKCNPNADRGRSFMGGTLRDDLRHLIPKLDFATDEAWHVLQQNQAYKDFTKTSIRSPRGSALVKLQRPRLAHALDMLTSPVPDGEFSYVAKGAMRGTSDRVGWVRESDKPCMVQVTMMGMMNGMPGDVADVFAFGNSTNSSERVPRNWLPHPEFMVMSTFSRLDVIGAFVGGGYRTLNAELPTPVRDFLSNRFSEMSWSAGVVAEVLLRAACMGPPPDRRQPKGTRDRPKTSWQGAWLRAFDRMSMFTHAMALTKDGFSVQSYGLGWVMCSATEDQMSDLMHRGMSLGLMPKFFDIPDGMFRPGNIPWNGDKRSIALATMTASKQKTKLWSIDRLPLYEPERQMEMLKKMM